MKPCGDNGTCTVEKDDYICTCTPKYKGKQCGELGECGTYNSEFDLLLGSILVEHSVKHFHLKWRTDLDF